MFTRVIGASITLTVAGMTLAACGSSPSSSTARAAGNHQPVQAAAPAPQVDATAHGRLKLYEFYTTGGKGYFYTANPTEAVNAVKKYKFTQIKHNLGYVYRKPFKGSVTLYRLRFKPFSSYIVTLSTKERDKLVRSGNFVYEGVLGYASKSPTKKVLLWRVANNNRWRLVTKAESKALVRKGWHSDGPVGYVWKSA
ncbi:hypothetical protein [Actinoallomurus sp. CA-150999]|uniref:hypothetical protein n=1 Tax=Actinoallomurus sp. CA-150999 TaxID=3239887 RepID=UPI003D901A5D